MTNTQVTKLRKAFVNNSSANKKLSKSQLHKIGRMLGPSLKIGVSLIGNELKALAKSV